MAKTINSTFSLKRLSIANLLVLFLGTSFLMLTSCEDGSQFVIVVDEPIVDAPIQAYYDRFIEEAAIRGLDVAYAASQVDAELGDISEPNVIGTCSWSQTHSHSITLDREYWQRANDMQREFLVFHELGHCVLGRDHRDQSDANGNCVSIMSSGTGDCRVVYTANNRHRLLDELFSN